MMGLVARALMSACAVYAACALAHPLVAAPAATAPPSTPPPPAQGLASASLLLAPSDLPPGYISDDALENADATARTGAYGSLIVSSRFAGYRRREGAVVHYVALLHSQAGAALFLAHEAAAVGRTREAAPLTLAVAHGAGALLAYQQRGTRGEEWVMAAWTAGPYATVMGVYAGEGEQPAIDLLQRLVAVAYARLRIAAARIPAPAPMPATPARPSLRVVTLVTTTRDKRPSDVFRPRSPLYWRALWRVEGPTRGVRETVRETVWQGKKTFYSNSLADMPYSGDNEVDDHLLLANLAPGHYNVTVVVTIGRLSAYATHTFHVSVARATTKG